MLYYEGGYVCGCIYVKEIIHLLIGREWADKTGSHISQSVEPTPSELRTQNSENDLFNPNITFCISFNK